jgi:hypothetical protein
MRRFFLCATVLALTLNTPGSLNSASLDNPVITRVEEDWQLIVATPDTTEQGPQATICMSPTSVQSDPFVAFDLNYREYPDFESGGMQVQVWSNNQVIQTATQHRDQFATDNETITWTQSMSLSDSQVTYQVKNGSSMTWGQFGGDDDLQVTFPTSAADLGAYSPDYSANSSGVTWQSNRVTSLTLVQIRYYAGSMLINTDTNPRVIVSNTSSSSDSNGQPSTQNSSGN